MPPDAPKVQITETPNATRIVLPPHGPLNPPWKFRGERTFTIAISIVAFILFAGLIAALLREDAPPFIELCKMRDRASTVAIIADLARASFLLGPFAAVAFAMWPLFRPFRTTLLLTRRRLRSARSVFAFRIFRDFPLAGTQAILIAPRRQSAAAHGYCVILAGGVWRPLHDDYLSHATAQELAKILQNQIARLGNVPLPLLDATADGPLDLTLLASAGERWSERIAGPDRIIASKWPRFDPGNLWREMGFRVLVYLMVASGLSVAAIAAFWSYLPELFDGSVGPGPLKPQAFIWLLTAINAIAIAAWLVDRTRRITFRISPDHIERAIRVAGIRFSSRFTRLGLIRLDLAVRALRDGASATVAFVGAEDRFPIPCSPFNHAAQLELARRLSAATGVPIHAVPPRPPSLQEETTPPPDCELRVTATDDGVIIDRPRDGCKRPYVLLIAFFCGIATVAPVMVFTSAEGSLPRIFLAAGFIDLFPLGFVVLIVWCLTIAQHWQVTPGALIYRATSIFGTRTRSWPRNSFSALEIAPFRTQSAVLVIKIHRTGDKPIRLSLTSSMTGVKYLAAVLRRALALPLAAAAADEPAPIEGNVKSAPK